MRALRSASMAVMLVAAVCGCATTTEQSADSRDPWESYNRSVSRLNDSLDQAVLRPVSVTYVEVTPSFMQRGVYNFFDNLSEASNAINHVLQGKWSDAGTSTGRLLLNSTLGLGGVLDVASRAGLSRSEPESFGQTLSVWGLGPGPYLVLPLLGPSTVTDALGKPVDWQTDPSNRVLEPRVRTPLRALDIVDGRARLLKAEQLLTGDRYVFLREAYLQRREYLVNDGAVEDDFGGDFNEVDLDEAGDDASMPDEADDFGFDF